MYERTLLERAARAVPPPEHVFDRIVRRRDRKMRNKRIRSALVASLVALAAIGFFIRAFHSSEHQVPATPTIVPSTLKDLGLSWSATGPFVPGPVTTSSMVIALEVGATGRYQEIAAFPKACPTEPAGCQAAWTHEASGKLITDGTDVYVASSSGGFVALDGSTGAELWRGEGEPVLVSGDRVYSGIGARVFVFAAAGCAASSGMCAPIGGWTLPGWRPGDVLGTLVPSQGVVVSYIERRVGSSLIVGWSSSCGSMTCSPVWSTQAQGWGDTVMAEGSSVYDVAQKTSKGLVVNADRCPTSGETTCAREWTETSMAIMRGVASSCCSATEANGEVFAIGHDGVVFRFDPSCAADPSCVPPAVAKTGMHDWLWVFATNGVLFAGNPYEGGSVVAYSASCLTVRGDCPVLWTAAPIGGPSNGASAPTVDSSGLYLIGGEAGTRGPKTLYAFAVKGSA